MFSKHYQDELAFLRATGREYARANPATAGLLAERGGDPDVERLLEGFAFLAARIRERIDQSVPELVQDLAEMVLPQFLRPVPSATIVELSPIPGAVRVRTPVKAGSELGSVPVDGTACRFTTTADLDLLPVAVVETALDQSVGAAPALRLLLQLTAPAPAAVLHRDGVRFYLHGEYPLAAMLLLWVARYLRAVTVRNPATGAAVELPAAAVRTPGLGQDLPLLPWPRLAPGGYRTLLDYFTLPQKLLFFDVLGLDAAKDLAGDRLELLLRFDRPPELPARPTRDMVRTNCVPAVNLFRCPGDPISVRALGEEHLVRAAGLSPSAAEVYDVAAVSGVAQGNGERSTYHAFAAFRHGADGPAARYYRLRRARSPVDGAVDTYLSVGRPSDAGAGLGPEVLSLDTLTTNRDLASRLRLGELCQPTRSSPSQARFRNIVPVTAPVRPSLGTELHWRLVAHLAANRVAASSADVLRALLALYNLPGAAEQQAGRANQLRIEAIEEVASAPARRLVGGAPARGTQVVVGLAENGFAGQGDAFLFGCAAADLLAGQVGLASFVELQLALRPSGRTLSWPARNGSKVLL